MFCKECGRAIKNAAVMCVHCGVPTKVTPQGSTVSTGTIIGAWFLALLMPFFGVIGGIYLCVKNQALHGVGCIVLSIMSWIFWAAVILAGS